MPDRETMERAVAECCRLVPEEDPRVIRRALEYAAEADPPFDLDRAAGDLDDDDREILARDVRGIIAHFNPTRGAYDNRFLPKFVR